MNKAVETRLNKSRPGGWIPQDGAHVERWIRRIPGGRSGWLRRRGGWPGRRMAGGIGWCMSLPWTAGFRFTTC